MQILKLDDADKNVMVLDFEKLERNLTALSIIRRGILRMSSRQGWKLNEGSSTRS